MTISRRTKAEFILLSLTVAWGSTFVLTKFILNEISVFLYLFIRFFIATILFGIITYKSIKSLSVQAFVSGSILGLLLYAGFVLQTYGLTITTASKSAFITGLMVVFAPLLQIIIQKKLPGIGNILGIVLVIVGLYLLTSPNGEGLNLGDIMTVGCALTFGLYIVLLDEYGKKHNPVHLTLMQFLITSIGAIPLLFYEQFVFNLSYISIGILLYLILVPTILALFLQAKYQKDTTPSRSAIIFSLEPPFAAFFAFIFINESLSSVGIIGALLIFSGVLVSELYDKPIIKAN